MLDSPKPTFIRTSVSFAGELLNDSDQVTVEGITARKAQSVAEVRRFMSEGDIPVMADPDCQTLRQFTPAVLIDGILAKKTWVLTAKWHRSPLPLAPDLMRMLQKPF